MEIPVRATIIFFFLWALTRGLGKRELAEMSAFELLLLVTVGDLVQQGVTQEDSSITGAILATGTIAFWVVLFAYVSFKLPGSRRVLEGVPVLIVRNGRPVDEALRLERLAVQEVLEEARQQGISDLSEVEVGVLEPDGRFSFIKADGEQRQPPEKPSV